MSFSTSEMKDLINKMVIYADTLPEEEQANFIFSTFYDVTGSVYTEFETQLRVCKVKLLPFAEKMNQYLHNSHCTSSPEVKFTKKEINSLIKHNCNAIIFLENEDITTEMLKGAFAQRRLGNSEKLHSKLSLLSEKFPLNDKQFQKDLTFWIKNKKSEICIKLHKLFVNVEHPPRWVQELYFSLGYTDLQHIDEDLQLKFLLKWKERKDNSCPLEGYISNMCKNYIPIIQWMKDHKVEKACWLNKSHYEQMCQDRVFKSIDEARKLFPEIESSTLMMYYLE